MTVVRDIEPWDALLQAGRDDDRLVMQASQHPWLRQYFHGKRARAVMA